MSSYFIKIPHSQTFTDITAVRKPQGKCRGRDSEKRTGECAYMNPFIPVKIFHAGVAPGKSGNDQNSLTRGNGSGYMSRQFIDFNIEKRSVSHAEKRRDGPGND
jgi:hypothetical protein